MTITYRDFNFKFEKDSYDGVSFVDDNDAIKQSIKDILLTRKGERVWNPLYGSNIFALLFEKVNNMTAMSIRDEIAVALENWEPRIRVVLIEINPFEDDNKYEVYITYDVLNLNLRTTFELTLNLLK